MLLLHLKADKELNILFVLHIFLQIIAVLALLEFHIALAALDDRTCRTCGKWSLQVLGLQGKYSLQGQQVRSSLHSPAQGPRDFPDVCGLLSTTHPIISWQNPAHRLSLNTPRFLRSIKAMAKWPKCRSMS